jgi:hypothetical protein
MHPRLCFGDRSTIARNLLFIVCACAVPGLAASASEIDIPAPPGSVAFGTFVTALPNGNIVVQDPYAATDAAHDVGAVYLYQPDGTLISTLYGSSPQDEIGNERVTVLPNGDFLVASTSWRNGGAARAGAVTYVSATTGLDGIVSAENSLVGSNTDDSVGQSIRVLANGNYLVVSWNWANGANPAAGAVTFVPADGSVRGAISPANSLVGSSAYDRVGEGVVALANGNYLVVSPSVDFGVATDAGAVTWANGSVGVVGTVSAANSLVGSHARDRLGANSGIVSTYALANGNAVVLSPGWDNGDVADVGAATWIDGAAGMTGTVSATNSLVGATTADSVGNALSWDAFAELPGGHYAIISPYWHDASNVQVGAITWGNSDGGTHGVVSATNSLVGNSVYDLSGARIFPLQNGHWAVGAPRWAHGDVAGAGAAIWIDSGAPRVGPLTAEGSLVGTSSGDMVGSHVVALTNGNYVVWTPRWNNGAVASAGAATWVDGSGPVTDEVSAENSLVGSTGGDSVGEVALGYDAGVVALANGNYVVLTSSWNNGGNFDVGAATWGDGTHGVSGPISSLNSLVGDVPYDGVGLAATALANGNVVISSTTWHDGVGAATWIDGSAGLAGTISEDNSLTGHLVGDSIGTVTAIPGHDGYFVSGAHWSDGNSSGLGAVAWGDGRAPLTGIVTPANALVGTLFQQLLGSEVVSYANGSAIITSDYSVTLARGTAPLAGTPNAENSVIAAEPQTHSFDYDVAHDRLVVGWQSAQYVAIFQTETLFKNGFD